MPASLPVPARGLLTAEKTRQRFSLDRGLKLLTVAVPAPAGPTELPVQIDFDDLFVPNRTQIEPRPCHPESLLPKGHGARLVWA